MKMKEIFGEHMVLQLSQDIFDFDLFGTEHKSSNNIYLKK